MRGYQGVYLCEQQRNEDDKHDLIGDIHAVFPEKRDTVVVPEDEACRERKHKACTDERAYHVDGGKV